MTAPIESVDSHGRSYRLCNETYYPANMPDVVIRVLETYRDTDVRLRLHYGDLETGQDWGDLYDVAGRIGRSTGPVRIPILLANTRSMGGGGIIGSIVRVRFANRAHGGDLYRHPSYRPPIGGAWSDAEYHRSFD